MDTMTTVESVEKTESGAFKITLLGDVVAGTRDAEIGALAESLAGQAEANPVAVKLEKLPGGKLLIKSMEEITAPPELGGEDVAKTEAIAPGSDPTGEVKPDTGATETAKPTAQADSDAAEPDSCDLSAISSQALLDELAARLA